MGNNQIFKPTLLSKMVNAKLTVIVCYQFEEKNIVYYNCQLSTRKLDGMQFQTVES